MIKLLYKPFEFEGISVGKVYTERGGDRVFRIEENEKNRKRIYEGCFGHWDSVPAQ